ncbi:hypothetical protein [Myroides sp. N17-2]|uniref:hypothetical protein n=1 Tax=Myroides sp. N17-2 TaxID=2030799 RepID=UPI0020B12296|nr:hypothetical protein [Myroides sp. N17-2]
MKTIIQTSKILSKIGMFLLIGGLTVSCGSYYNTSYNDGVYSQSGNTQPNRNDQNPDRNYYEEYFKSKSNDMEYFTDVNQYTSPVNDSVIQHKPKQAVSYGSWGSEPSSINVNFYNNGYYGSSYYGYGYGYPYYGGYYGSYYDPFYWGGGFGISVGWGW